MNHRNREKLPGTLRLALFFTSYIPLFFLIILKQVLENLDYLHFGGFGREAVLMFLGKFFVAFVLFLFSLYGALGILAFTRGMKSLAVNNGFPFLVKKVHNKNTESIGYIATYLVPFMFQAFSSPFEVVSFFVLLSVIYTIYTHSTLIVVNPILNLRYSLYDIEYRDEKADVEKEGTFIVDCHYVEAGDRILAKSIGSNLYFAIIDGGNDE